MTILQVPDRMAKLPRDKRGYPIPYNVMIDEEGEPMFTVNSSPQTGRCIRRKLCSICGERLTKALWFVGGPGSAFHPHGVYFDPPMHHECATFALKHCPFLSHPNYSSVLKKPNVKLLQERAGAAILVDRTADPNRPKFFVMVQAFGMSILPDPVVSAHLRPLRPYHDVEFWRHGKRLPLEEGVAALPRDQHLDLTSLRLIVRRQA